MKEYFCLQQLAIQNAAKGFNRKLNGIRLLTSEGWGLDNNVKEAQVFGTLRVLLDRYLHQIETLNENTYNGMREALICLKYRKDIIQKLRWEEQRALEKSKKIQNNSLIFKNNRHLDSSEIQTGVENQFKFSTKNEEMTASTLLECQKPARQLPNPSQRGILRVKRKPLGVKRPSRRCRGSEGPSKMELIERKSEQARLAKRKPKKEEPSPLSKRKSTNVTPVSRKVKIEEKSSKPRSKRALRKLDYRKSRKVKKEEELSIDSGDKENIPNFNLKIEDAQIISSKVESTRKNEKIATSKFSQTTTPCCKFQLTIEEQAILSRIKAKAPVFFFSKHSQTEKVTGTSVGTQDHFMDLTNKVIKAHERDLGRQTLITQQEIINAPPTNRPTFDSISFRNSLLQKLNNDKKLKDNENQKTINTSSSGSNSPEFVFLGNKSGVSTLKASKKMYKALISRDIGHILAVSKISLTSDIFMVSAVGGLYFVFFNDQDSNVYLKKIDVINPRLHYRFSQIVPFYTQKVVFIVDGTQGVMMRYCLKEHRIMKCSNIDELKPRYIINQGDERLCIVLRDGSIAFSRKIAVQHPLVQLDFVHSGFSVRRRPFMFGSKVLDVDYLRVIENCQRSLLFLNFEEGVFIQAKFTNSEQDEPDIQVLKIDIPPNEQVVQMSQFESSIAVASTSRTQEGAISRILVYSLKEDVLTLQKRIYLFSQSNPIVMRPGKTFLKMLSSTRVAVIQQTEENLKIDVFGSKKKNESISTIIEERTEFINQVLMPLTSGDSIWIFGSKMVVQKLEISSTLNNNKQASTL